METLCQDGALPNAFYLKNFSPTTSATSLRADQPADHAVRVPSMRSLGTVEVRPVPEVLAAYVQPSWPLSAQNFSSPDSNLINQMEICG